MGEKAECKIKVKDEWKKKKRHISSKMFTITRAHSPSCFGSQWAAATYTHGISCIIFEEVVPDREEGGGMGETGKIKQISQETERAAEDNSVGIEG